MKETFIHRAFHAIARRVRGTIWRVSTSEPVIAITFDDGPNPGVTPRLLEILGHYRARGTFFMLGASAEKYPEIVRDVASDGHAIGNHSWDHPSFPEISKKERRKQIRGCDQALSPYGLRLFRPPFGHQDRNTFLDAVSLGHQVVLWNVDSRDWLDQDGYQIAKQLEEKTIPGSILLFHDSVSTVFEERLASRERTLTAVQMLLGRLGNRFRFVTVPELLRHGRPHRIEWNSLGSSDLFRRLLEPDGTPWRHRPAQEKADP